MQLFALCFGVILMKNVVMGANLGVLHISTLFKFQLKYVIEEYATKPKSQNPEHMPIRQQMKYKIDPC